MPHMPTKNPRLSVVLSPSLAATLAALSEETGDSASGLVRGLLEQTEPALQRMLHLMKAANAAKGNIGAGVGGTLLRVVSDLEGAMGQADRRLDSAVRDLVDAAEAVKGRRRQRASAASTGPVAAVSTPGLVTRGSGRADQGKKAKTSGGRRGTV